MLELNNIYNMDCLEGLKLLDNNSIDSIVTDPPYELGFMGKQWDNTGIAHSVDLWKECLRVLKPGGCLLSFGGTRTYHRMACAIEDAGFEIRDQIQWLYGSGFPKSMDISKALDKKLKVERNAVIGISNSKGIRPGQGNYVGDNYDCKGYEITAPATPEAQQWDGWGTALKPANEPICLARKPLSEKTVAENVLKWGTGGLNIDGCRVKLNGEKNPSITRYNSTPQKGNNGWEHKNRGANFNEQTQLSMEQGRFPANVILDEEAGKILDKQSGISTRTDKRLTCESGDTAIWGIKNKTKTNRPMDFGGGASRFFYCAKTSKKERGEGNNHPTVKPINLIKYLITLITPPKGIVLDPFMGSGTTALSCINLGFNYIGFEKESTYCSIIKKRILDMVR